MKTIEKLKVQNVPQIAKEEQKSLKGGGEWVTGPDGQEYYSPGMVEIYGQDPNLIPAPCPGCVDFNTANNNQPSMGVAGEAPALSWFGELVFNTIPHLLGWGNHEGGGFGAEWSISVDGGKNWIYSNNIE